MQKKLKYYTAEIKNLRRLKISNSEQMAAEKIAPKMLIFFKLVLKC